MEIDIYEGVGCSFLTKFLFWLPERHHGHHLFVIKQFFIHTIEETKSSWRERRVRDFLSARREFWWKCCRQNHKQSTRPAMNSLAPFVLRRPWWKNIQQPLRDAPKIHRTFWPPSKHGQISTWPLDFSSPLWDSCFNVASTVESTETCTPAICDSWRAGKCSSTHKSIYRIFSWLSSNSRCYNDSFD